MTPAGEPPAPADLPGSAPAVVANDQAGWRPTTVIAAIAAQTLAVLLIVATAGGLLPVGPTGGGASVAPAMTVRPRDGAAPADLRAPPPQVIVSDGARTLPPTAEGKSGEIQATAEHLVVWEDAFGEVRLQVVATARNRTALPVAVAASSSTWAIIDRAGDEVARGRFSHSFPPVVAPQETVLLVEDLTTSFPQPEELSRVQVDLVAEPVVQPTGVVPLEVTDVFWSQSSDDGLVVHARVSNASQTDVSKATLGVVLRDATDQILCSVYDVSVGEIGAGESRSVITAYPGTSPVDPDLVAKAEGAAAGER